jgi:ribosomal protein L24E
MQDLISLRSAAVLAIAILPLAIGCQGGSTPSGQSNSDRPATAGQAAADPDTSDRSSASDSAADSGGKRKRRQVRLDSVGAGPGGVDSPAVIEDVMSALQPLQILLGSWNGTTRRALLDQPQWIWDLQTNPAQPALMMKSEKGTYLKQARLTFLKATQEFELTGTDGEGTKRVYRGSLVEPVKEEIGDDRKTHRSFKLELTQADDASQPEQWRLTLAQLDNNRYLLEVDRKRGSGGYQRVDTVNTMREGESFAARSFDDYGEKTCIISEGLGTITVSHKGKSYWVCCTGCKSAFEENPEKWIARWEEKQKSRKTL